MIENNIVSISRKRNVAKDTLYKKMEEYQNKWKETNELLECYKQQFLPLWEAYKTNPRYIEEKFFVCCENLYNFIYQEEKMRKEFEKNYKPFYDKFQKLDKEYHQMKSKQKEKL